jgi:hypothetical protein
MLKTERRSTTKYRYEAPLFFTVVYLADRHVFCCGAFFALNNIKSYSLAFGQSLETAGLNSAKVDENVPAITLFDKSKTFTFIKPFYFTF